jgi:Tol biopolymer transport system component
VTDLDARVTELLAELAEAVPVETRNAPAGPAVVGRDLDDRREYPVRPLGSQRPRRQLVLVAAAAVLAVALVAGVVVVRSGDRSPVSVSATDVPVDTAALGTGRMAVVIENDLYVADGPTGAVWKLTDVGKGEEVSDVSFSHDGEWVAFTIHDESGLWVSRWDGSEQHRIGRAPTSYSWSPTDDQLAYATQDQVRVAQTDGSSRSLEGGSAPKAYTRVVWSPDGTTLAFVLDPGGVARATLIGNTEAGWSTSNPPAEEVLAWPTAEAVLVRNAWPSGSDDPNTDRLGVVDPITGEATDLAWTPRGATPSTVGDRVATITARATVTARGGVEVCDLRGLTCSAAVALAEGMTLTQVSLSPNGLHVAVIGTEARGSQVQLATVGASSGLSFPDVDDLTRGTIDLDGVGYRIEPEPPLWSSGSTVLVRTFEAAVEAFTSDGSRTTVVRGARFLAPADDYPGGTGLAYWSPG